MDQIVKNTTERLLRKLNPEQPFYTPSDMLDAGFPAFVVERIRLELETNLADSIVPPSTDWAIMNAEEVTGAWQQFLDAIHNQLRLPNSFAKGVIESSVADLVDILVEPRKNLPDYLFVSTDELFQEEIDERIRWVVVYPHFASFLPRYMKSKKLDKISRERYAKAIAQIDEKLSERYSPLNWAQVLKPMFSLFNEELEPEVLGRFFRDKNMLIEAERFENLKDPVDDHRFIEILSRPDFNDDEDTGFLSAASFSKSKVEKHGPVDEEVEEAITQTKNEKTEIEAEEKDEDEEKPLYSTLVTDEDEDEETEDALPDELKDGRRTTIAQVPAHDEDDSEDDIPETPEEVQAGDEEDDAEEGYTTLHSHWASKQKLKDEKSGDEEEDDEGFIAKPISEDESEDEDNDDNASFSPLYARFQQASDDDEDDDKVDKTRAGKGGVEDQDDDDKYDTEPVRPEDYSREVQDYDADKELNDEADLKPRPSDSILRSLGSVKDEDDEDEDDEKDIQSSRIGADDDDESGDETYIPLWQRLSVGEDDDEPGISAVPAEEKESADRRDSIVNPDSEDGMAQKLISYLKNDRKLYIKEIFKNDEAAYIRALTVLSEFRSWREAGKYLTNDIFRKNGIDMYKDVTVDFTDRLHKFFTDNMRR